MILALVLVVPVLAQNYSLDAQAKKTGKKGKTEVVEKKDTVKRKKTSKYDKMFTKDKTCVTAR